MWIKTFLLVSLTLIIMNSVASSKILKVTNLAESVTENKLYTMFLSYVEHNITVKMDGKRDKTSLIEPGIMNILDFAFTPTHLILLRDDSAFYLHPSNTALKGFGFNSFSKKFGLGAIVRRTWCAATATPKSNNEVVPAFSKDGHIIILYPVPVEGSQSINLDPPSLKCYPVLDSTSPGTQAAVQKPLTESEIHAGEERDPDAIVKAKRETKAEKARKLHEEEEKERRQEKEGENDVNVNEDKVRVFWFAGKEILRNSDPHYSRGATDPSNVKVSSNYKAYNKNIIFVIEKDFENIRAKMKYNGLNFNVEEILYTAGTNKTFVRDASNRQLFALHAVEFSAVEKTLLTAIEFQSHEFSRNKKVNETNANVSSITILYNDLTIFVSTITAADFPSEIEADKESEIYLEDIIVTFSGSVLYRDDLDGGPNSTLMDPEYRVDETDSMDKISSKNLQPKPLAKRISTMRTINTAIPIYIIRLGDVTVYASLDGSFARPITFYWDNNPKPGKDPNDDNERRIKPLVRIPTGNYDTLVTEKGVISILTRRPVGLHSPQRALIGSLLTNEPLRTIRPFLETDNYFQIVAPEGEILYGKAGTLRDTSTLQNPPSTRGIPIPFWSLLLGSKDHSLGENDFISEPDPHDNFTSEGVEANFNEICPFASFTVDFVHYNYVEAGYRTRITAEIAFYGDMIPLEADLIIEFTEVLGMSIVISSRLEVMNDQTIIRKSIDIQTFMTDQTIDDTYKYYLTHSDTEPVPELIRVFTMTIRPSIVNLKCSKDNYFQTVQMNIGCVPTKTGEVNMRLIGEALEIKKKKFVNFNENIKDDDLNDETVGHFDEKNDVLMIVRDNVHHEQRGLFGCVDKNETYCKIPNAHLIKDNFYDLSMRNGIVPKFEQFLTRHARRVTSNIILYDILGSYTYDDDKNNMSIQERDSIDRDHRERHPTRMFVNTTQWNAKCVIDDGNWYGNLASKTTVGKVPQLLLSTDIYQHFNNCFSRTPSVSASTNSLLLDREDPQKLNDRLYFVFNDSNQNQLKLGRKRNWIYMIRAVVLNTKYNAFTYCQKLETFFVLRASEIPAQREPLAWYIYLSITIFVLFCVWLTYVYFSRYYSWRKDNTTNSDLEKRQVEFFAERSKLPAHILDLPKNKFKRLVRRIQLLEKWKDMTKLDSKAKSGQSKPKPLNTTEFESNLKTFKKPKPLAPATKN